MSITICVSIGIVALDMASSGDQGHGVTKGLTIFERSHGSGTWENGDRRRSGGLGIVSPRWDGDGVKL